QLLARLPATHEPGVEQPPGFDFAGGGSLVLDDQVELVSAGDRPVEVDLRAERAQVLLDGTGRGAGGAGRTVEARTDRAADAQRRVVDLDRPRIEHQSSVAPLDRELEVETGAEGQRFERPRGARCRAAAERDVDGRSRRYLRKFDGAGDHRGDLFGFGPAEAGPREHASEAVTAHERGLEIEAGALRGVAQR